MAKLEKLGHQSGSPREGLIHLVFVSSKLQIAMLKGDPFRADESIQKGILAETSLRLQQHSIFGTDSFQGRGRERGMGGQQSMEDAAKEGVDMPFVAEDVQLIREGKPKLSAIFT